MAKINVISHRGSNRIAPQNTLPAFKQSIIYGADGFETDVHLTLDGVPVICHDYEVDDMSDGSGEITSMTLDQLKGLDFGLKFHRSYKNTRLPTLEEFLTLCEKAKLKVLNIEIKPPKNKEYTVVEMVIDAVKAHGLYDKLLISSFDENAVVYAKDVDETCKTAVLFSPNRRIDFKYFLHYVDCAKAVGADALHPHKSYITKAFVKKAHDAGLIVNPWTVNSERDIRYVIECGVDGIITDVPNIAKKILEEY